jgi:signal transduction histidine kinase
MDDHKRELRTKAQLNEQDDELQRWLDEVEQALGADARLSAQSEELPSQAEEEPAWAAALTPGADTSRESEQRLALALSGTRVGMYERDLATGECWGTEQAARLLGLRTTTTTTTTPTTLSQSYYYRDWAERVHPEDLPRVEAELQGCLTERAACETEYRVVWPAGDEHWVADRSVFQYDQDGEPTRMLGILMDITDRKTAQEDLAHAYHRLQVQAENLAAANEQLLTQKEELQRQTQELQEIKEQAEHALREVKGLDRTVEESPHPVLRISLEGEILYRNAAAQELCRQWDLVGPTIRKMASAAYDKGQILRRERVLRNRVYTLTAAPAPGTGYITIYAHDITERNQSEQNLRLSEQRLAALLAASSEVLYRMSPDWSEMRQLRSRGLLASRESSSRTWLEEYIPPEDQTRVMAIIQEAIRTKSVFELEHRVRHADGSIGWTFSRAIPLLDAEGEIREWFGEASDITERKRMEETLREWNSALESKVAQRTAELKRRTQQLQKLTLQMAEAEDRERERIAQVLHDDLQQELAAAKFHLSILRSRVQCEPAVQEIAAQVNEMLKDAIGKSRSLSHELNPAMWHEDDLDEILRRLAGEMYDKLGLTVRVQGQALSLSDPIKAVVYRATRELLFNAVKHARVSEARLRVRQHGGYVCLTISDRGRGFDPGKLRETAGFGLLSIRERVELLGGRMKIRSAPGRGSTFVVVVPGRSDRSARPPCLPNTRQPRGQGGRPRGAAPTRAVS